MTKEKFEELNNKHSNQEDKKNNKQLYDLAINILNAIGGKENIIKINACITRLRIDVNNIREVDKEEIIELGAQGIFEVRNGIQAVFGTKSNKIKDLMKNLIEDKTIKSTKAVYEDQNNTIKKTNNDLFVSPLSGKILDLKEVPDQVFSKKMIGEGFAIEPVSGDVVSPVNGKVMTIFPTKHAICIIADNGQEVLIHFGIDTVKLKGQGFQLLIKEGQRVKIKQPILRVDLEIIKTKISSIITPIIFTNLPKAQCVVFKEGKEVKAGQEDIIEIL